MSDSTYSVNVDIECRSCKGTGLYVGIGERDGAAVICHTCKGTGCENISFTYPKFKQRKRRDDVKRVFKNAFMYCHCPNDVTSPDDGRLIEFSKGGCSYDEFLQGVQPKPVKTLYCPYQWTHQNSDGSMDALARSRCDGNVRCGQTYNECKLHCDMAECWRLYEQGGGK